MTERDARKELEAIDAVFKALDHPTRRQILMVLHFRGDAMTAGEIAARFSCRWPTVSRHIQVLERAGLVASKGAAESAYTALNATI